MPPRDTEYRGREIRLYGEYGVLEGFTAYGSFTVKQVRITEPLFIVPGRVLPESVHQTTGAGDVYLGGRLRLRRGPEPVSLSAEVKIPSGYSARANPSLGTGQADVTLRGLVGASARWIYATADAGWTHRGGPYQDEALFSFEVGGHTLHYYTWRGVIRGVRSVGISSVALNEAVFDPALASPRSLTLDAVVGDDVLPGLDLEAGISHVLSGRNVLAGNTLEVGLAFSIRLDR